MHGLNYEVNSKLRYFIFFSHHDYWSIFEIFEQFIFPKYLCKILQYLRISLMRNNVFNQFNNKSNYWNYIFYFSCTTSRRSRWWGINTVHLPRGRSFIYIIYIILHFLSIKFLKIRSLSVRALLHICCEKYEIAK